FIQIDDDVDKWYVNMKSKMTSSLSNIIWNIHGWRDTKSSQKLVSHVPRIDPTMMERWCSFLEQPKEVHLKFEVKWGMMM
ncbi:hypothetical protein EJB05_33780, partial [Eragrostis curvula]